MAPTRSSVMAASGHDQPAQIAGHRGAQFAGAVIQDEDAVDLVAGVVAA